MPFYRSAGLNLHYSEHGSGEPLVLVHGFAQDSSAWVDPLPHYSKHFRVILLDVRGAGQSEVGPSGFGPAAIASDVLVLIDHLGLHKIHFGGFSLGGAVGLEFAIAHPDRLSSLSLHSTWVGGPVPHMTRWMEVRRRVIASGDDYTNINTRIVSFFSPEFCDRHPDRVDEFIARSRQNPHPITVQGAQAHAAAVLNHDVRGRLNQISVPTLITVGSMDRSTLPSDARDIHEQIHGSELVFIDGAGHFTPFECSKEFASISLGFLIKHVGKLA